MPIVAKSYEPVPARHLAFIGLGTMGSAMAAHLVRAGHRLSVFNRSAAKAQAWVAEHGGRAALSPADAACGADMLLLCVGRDEDVRQVLLGEGLPGGMADGALSTPAPLCGVVFHSSSSADLDSIKGIGPNTSSRILKERKTAPFKNWGDLIQRVPGIGDKRAAQLSTEGLTVNGEAFKPARSGASDKSTAKQHEDKKPASAIKRATSATRRMFSTRSASVKPRSRLRPWRTLSPSRM